MSQATLSQISTYIYAAGVAGAAVLGTSFYQEGFLSTSRLPSALYQTHPDHELFIEIVARPWITLALLTVVIATMLLAFRMSVKLFYGAMTDLEASFLRNALIQSTELDFVLLLSGSELTDRPTRLHWIAWLGVLCYLDCIQRLAHVRLEYLPPAPITNAHRFSIAALLYSLTGVTIGVAATLFYLRDEGPLFLFVWLYYSARILFRIGHTGTRFLINRSDPPSLDGRHYADVVFKAAAYLLGAAHTLVLLCLDSLESFVSILLLIRMGQQLVDLRGVWTLHNNYLILQQRLASLCPPPTQEQLDQFNDVCPVCRDAMVVETSRILPCRHMLHGECLRQWLLQQPSCPVCRAELPLAPPPSQTDMRLNFNGNRLSRWLPNVSVQVGVTHGPHTHAHPHPHPHPLMHPPHAHSPLHMGVRGAGSPLPSPRWDMLEPPQEWVDGLTTMFPDAHPELVRRDLAMTHSLDLTANNILTNRNRFQYDFVGVDDTGVHLDTHPVDGARGEQDHVPRDDDDLGHFADQQDMQQSYEQDGNDADAWQDLDEYVPPVISFVSPSAAVSPPRTASTMASPRTLPLSSPLLADALSAALASTADPTVPSPAFLSSGAAVASSSNVAAVSPSRLEEPLASEGQAAQCSSKEEAEVPSLVSTEPASTSAAGHSAAPSLAPATPLARTVSTQPHMTAVGTPLAAAAALARATSLPAAVSTPAPASTPAASSSPSTESTAGAPEAPPTPMDNRTRRALLAEAAERRRLARGAAPEN